MAISQVRICAILSTSVGHILYGLHMSFDEAIASGVRWASCGELKSISGYKAMVFFCLKLTATVTYHFIWNSKTEMEKLTAEITSLDVSVMEWTF